MDEKLIGKVMPGTGNLNLRAAFAAIVGPKRLAHGIRRTKVLDASKSSTLIARNPDAQNKELCTYVSVTLSQAFTPGTYTVVFGGDQAVNGNSGIPIKFTDSTPNAFELYGEVLLPGEELYAQVSTGTVQVTITEVSF